MGGEDKLGSSTSFSVPVLRALEVFQYLKLDSVDFFGKVSFYQSSDLPRRCVRRTKQQLL